MDELRILTARLGWPSSSTRWWAMQELAARLGNPALSTETESALCKLLHSRKLEAEAVEILCIFWIAAKKYVYSPRKELVVSITRPSLLTHIFITNLGLTASSGNQGLKVAPEDFEIPDDFEGVQGVDLPRIFRTSMSTLEAHFGLPFVRQMAFEWATNRLAYPDVPYQGNLRYFMQSLGSDLVSQLTARPALRAISAYLRTLAVAKHFWSMPSELAKTKSLLALPIHPTLAFLRPQPPSWFPKPIDFESNTGTVEAIIRNLIKDVGEEHEGNELISFSSPIAVSLEWCVEVSVVKWLQSSGGLISDCDLAAHHKGSWSRFGLLSSAASEPLSTRTVALSPVFEELVDKESKAWPLAGTLDFNRIGYLQSDLYPSRLFFPTMSGMQEIEITPSDGGLEAKVAGGTVADFFYWNAGWGPARPQQLSGNCGTALISRGTAYREGAGREPSRTFYLWQVRSLRRSSNLDNFDEEILDGCIFV